MRHRPKCEDRSRNNVVARGHGCVYMGVGDGRRVAVRQQHKVPATDAAHSAPSVTHVTVLVPDDPQEVEAKGQQRGSQQVPQRRQVRDGEAVGVFAAPPHGVDHPVSNAQQQQHLEEGEETKDWGWGSPGYPEPWGQVFLSIHFSDDSLTLTPNICS